MISVRCVEAQMKAVALKKQISEQKKLRSKVNKMDKSYKQRKNSVEKNKKYTKDGRSVHSSSMQAKIIDYSV